MAVAVRMPKISENMKYGIITKWYTKKNEKVKINNVLAEVETEKVTIELEVYENGVVLYLAELNKPVIVDGLIAVIGSENEDISMILENEKSNYLEKTYFQKLSENIVNFFHKLLIKN